MLHRRDASDEDFKVAARLDGRSNALSLPTSLRISARTGSDALACDFVRAIALTSSRMDDDAIVEGGFQARLEETDGEILKAPRRMSWANAYWIGSSIASVSLI